MTTLDAPLQVDLPQVEPQPQPQPATATDNTIGTAVKAAGRARARIQIGPALRKTGATFRPPELWTERQPSLKDAYHYAWFGEWTGPNTFGRFLGRCYAAAVSIPALFVGYLLLWVIVRPARLAALVLLTVLVGLTPAGGAVLSALAAALRWAANLTA